MKGKEVLRGLLFVIIGAVAGALIVIHSERRHEITEVRIGALKPPVSSVESSFNRAFVQVAEKVTPSIVKISVIQKTTENPHQGLPFFIPFADSLPREQRGGGSGVIISPNGYILTNNHVVESAIFLRVTLYDKREFVARIVGVDSLTDLAVIKIEAKNLPVAYLGDSDKLKVGEWVMAIGNPLSLSSTVTAGIVSAVGRNLNLIRDSYGVEDYIQTDAAINPGNSGGALVNLNGAVVGINSAIATNGMTTSYIGYGFAIPINLAKAVAKDLIAYGEIRRGYIGVNISEVDASTAKAIGLEKPQGVLVQGILEGSSASEKDIRPGDVILKVNGREVNMPNELQTYVAYFRAGDEIRLTIFRDGRIIERRVILKPRENFSRGKHAIIPHEEKEKPEARRKVQTKEFEKLGMTVREVLPDELNTFKAKGGVIITEVKRFGVADDKRLMKGALITEVNKKPIKSLKEFVKAIDSARGSAVLLKVIYPDGTVRYIGLEIPK